MTATNYLLDSILIIYILYFLIFVVLGLFDNDFFTSNKQDDNYDPVNKFAVVIPAHNEENVLANLLEDVSNLDYPSHLYDIFVVADNCKDSTAELARSYSAVNVFERTNPNKKGKGYALKHGFKKLGILDGSTDYDAVTVFDADNLVQQNFLQVMNDRLLRGERVVQAYVDSKNPVDNWVTATFSMMFWINDRYTMLSRYNVGLSGVLMGTGMCISTETLSQTGWETTTLTEDLEYSIQALMEGIKTTFTRDTKIFDEKPVSFWASCRQRLRWARGQLAVIKNYVPRLIYQAVKERNIVKLDGGIRLFQMPFLMFYFFVTVLRYSFPEFFSSPLFAYAIDHVSVLGLILPLIPYIIPSSVFALDSLPYHAFKYVVLFPVFMYSWVGILYWALFTMDKTEWLHTEHFRNVNKPDVDANNHTHQEEAQSGFSKRMHLNTAKLPHHPQKWLL